MQTFFCTRFACTSGITKCRYLVKLTFKKRRGGAFGGPEYKTELSNVELLIRKLFLLYSSTIRVNRSVHIIVNVLYYRSIHLCRTTWWRVTMILSWKALFFWCFIMFFLQWNNCKTKKITWCRRGEKWTEALPQKQSAAFVSLQAVSQTGAAGWAGLTGLRWGWVTQWQRSQQHSRYKGQSYNDLYIAVRPQNPGKKQVKSNSDYTLCHTDKYERLKICVTSNEKEWTKVNTSIILCMNIYIMCRIERN